MVNHNNNSRLLGLDCALETSINKKYKLKEVLGKGTFGVVRRCKSKETGEVLAVKTILKSKVPNFDTLKREIEILNEVDHPHIIKLHDVYEDSKAIHLVTELCTGGELYDKVIEKTNSAEGHFSEYDAGRIIRNIMEAIAYCHDVKNIVHRDLKPENFLLLNEHDNSPVKIIDFGLSRHTDMTRTGDGGGSDGGGGGCGGGSGIMTTRVGTVYYVAPEVLSAKNYTSKCDVWSIGIITYVLLCGYPPFLGENEILTLSLVKNATEIVFPSPGPWDEISNEAKDFIKFLLDPNPTSRPTASQALHHAWLNNSFIQPSGVCRRASFACNHRNISMETEPIKMNKIVGGSCDDPTTDCPSHHHNTTKKRTMFQKLLTVTKIKKSHKASLHHDHDHHQNHHDR